MQIINNFQFILVYLIINNLTIYKLCKFFLMMRSLKKWL